MALAGEHHVALPTPTPLQEAHATRIAQTKAAYDRKHAKQVATWKWKTEAWAEYRAIKAAAAAEQQAQEDAPNTR